VGSTQCGNLGWELEPQVLAVWRAVELRAGVDNGAEAHTAVHPHSLPQRVRTHNDMLKECSRGGARGPRPLSSGVTFEWV
jgi:hypothetical protein